MKKQWWHNIPEEDYCYESATSLATASILLRGLPMLYQGQEIGMKLKEAFRSVLHCCRDHARTPVQWTAGENAGFTTATPG